MGEGRNVKSYSAIFNDTKILWFIGENYIHESSGAASRVPQTHPHPRGQDHPSPSSQ